MLRMLLKRAQKQSAAGRIRRDPLWRIKFREFLLPYPSTQVSIFVARYYYLIDRAGSDKNRDFN